MGCVYQRFNRVICWAPFTWAEEAYRSEEAIGRYGFDDLEDLSVAQDEEAGTDLNPFPLKRLLLGIRDQAATSTTRLCLSRAARVTCAAWGGEHIPDHGLISKTNTRQARILTALVGRSGSIIPTREITAGSRDGKQIIGVAARLEVMVEFTKRRESAFAV